MLREGWAPTLRRAGIAYRNFHQLRHTFISTLLSAGAPLAQVSKLAGHANLSITLSIYTRFGPGIAEGVGAKLDQLFGPSGSRTVATAPRGSCGRGCDSGSSR